MVIANARRRGNWRRTLSLLHSQRDLRPGLADLRLGTTRRYARDRDGTPRVGAIRERRREAQRTLDEREEEGVSETRQQRTAFFENTGKQPERERQSAPEKTT